MSETTQSTVSDVAQSQLPQITSSPKAGDPIPLAPTSPPVRTPLIIAVIVILFFFGALGSWASLAPMDSAAVAPARVTVAGNRKSVQHLEGGIVAELTVREGDRVARGDLLLTLNDTRARATLIQLRARYYNLLAREARLRTERVASQTEIRFVDTLTQRADEPLVAEAMTGEQAIYEARQTFIDGRKGIFRQRVVQLEKEIDSLRAQIDAETIQIGLVRQEKEAVETLFDQGIIEMPRLLAVKRAEAGLQGSQGEHLGLIARAQQRIGETQLQMIDLENRLLNEVVSELKQTQSELADVSQSLKAAEDVLLRTRVRAPVSGIVVALDVHTEGGVIAPGQKILDIVPQEDQLELEVQLDPNDIDVVHAGLSAEVMLTAYKQRTTPTLTGTVSRISADSFSDPRTGRTYFIARVTVEPEELERMHEVDLYPGMPAQVLISTGSRTALDYLLAPITQSLQRAFRES